MKRISKRSAVLMILLAVLAAGAVFFGVRYVMYSGQWAVFSGSPHLYQGGNISDGLVTDRGGVKLLDGTDGRSYAEDETLRRATMHLLGDRYGYIDAPMLDPYTDKIAGHNIINGLYRAPQRINAVTLTISSQVQKAALEALGSRKGTIGVYNYQTGEILCSVTAPTYDPDNAPNVESDTTGAYTGVYVNRFFQMTYVPGSIFKVLTSVAAIENMEDVFDRSFVCEGTMTVGSDDIICSSTHGTINFRQALAKSCNCVFGQLAMELGKDTLTKYAKKAGIMSSLEIDGIRTKAGNFDLSDAAVGQVAWAGIGQHTDLVNPCQYMQFMGAIGGGGKSAAPYLVQSVTSGLIGSHEGKTVLSERVMSEETAEILASMMRDNVVSVYGTEHFPPVQVCAKSGTAEVGEGLTPHATFAGFVAEEKYPLAFVVIVEHGGSGSATCAPIAGKVLSACVEAMDAEK